MHRTLRIQPVRSAYHPMPMPNRVLIIGILFCLGGLLAIWEVIFSALGGRLNLNFAVCLLPVGIGLLRGRRRSLWWARFWMILGYLLCAFLIIISIAAPNAAHASVFGRETSGPGAVPYVILAALLLAATLALLHRLLCSEKARDYLDQ
ncbi:MAG: hypothetical protein QOE70_5596 [Chthoniobacter sp.]|jgi:hypothetical protein|nr:hypothetical protein [Chthoniobacter sp.]